MDLHAPLPTQAELAAFARAAGRLLATAAPRLGISQATRRRRGAGLLFLEHRFYQPGDDIRRIDWPQTARMRKPVLREYQAERCADWLVCVDASSSMSTAADSKWNYAVQCAAGMSYVLLELGYRVGLAVYTDQVRRACAAGRGPAQYLRIGAVLAQGPPATRAARTLLGCCLPRLSGMSAAMIFSDFLVEPARGLKSDLAGFAAQCADAHAMQIRDARDLTLPAAPLLELVDSETAEHFLCAASGSADERIATACAEQTRQLAALCSRAGIQFSSGDVAVSWQRALLRHLAGRARR